MKKLDWRVLPIVLFMLLSVFLWRGLSSDPHHLPSVQIGKPLPVFDLAQLQNPQLRWTSHDVPRQVWLLNVWASWCQACNEEQVMLLQLAQAGVPIYGLNYKDKADEALAWLKEWGNPYRMIIQDPEGKTAIDLGVYGAPESFVIDKQGIIRYRHVGVMNQQVWTQTIAPLMKQLEQQA
ncbi:MAG: DsbE family thiol:disulfide interchange protein [Legionella sp.]|nr:MAG: DsbE family thiol:disulfide interchange protein [Legionella sp.]